MKIKAAILTEHRARNFGSCLQAYALQEYLRSKNVDVNILDYRPQAIEDSFGVYIVDLYNQAKGNLKDLIIFYIKTIVFAPLRMKRESNFKKFRNQYFSLTENKYTDETITQTKEKFDIYFYGSDQVWNPKITRGLNRAYFGEPFSREAIHASYAASIGLNHLNNQDEEFKQLLTNLDFIAVREEDAKELIQPLTDKEVNIVLDPTLLVEKEVWDRMIHPISYKEDYILVYSLKVDQNLIHYVRKLSEEKGLKVIFFDINKRYGRNSDALFPANPADFVSLLSNAKYVVTNSFHGTVFSIIFNRQFICVPMEGTSSRMVNLLEKLGISNRLIMNCNSIDEEIDYTSVNSKIKELRKGSQDYIEQVLNYHEQNKKTTK